ncbi:DUF445 domain-containing protein [Synechococcus sp. PCC 7336]|uniref:DUF445 domain-containing protein n=1 Tax=Synechococcus sp. PCC 7336 TaxID=195250 RepID=UPI000347AA2D|nr:DUF445 family protein [Synechococcus sp. PCC 7336]
MNLWVYFVPPLAGLAIGYCTNDIAIKMLFRPYRPYYVGGVKLPFTPGLIPQNQGRLAQKISDAILGSLLTPEELHKVALRLLAPQRVSAAIQWLLELAVDRLQNPQQQEQTALVLGNILADLFGESLPRLIRALARQEDFLEAQLNQIFDRILLDLRLSSPQAQQFSTWILEQVVPPDVLRQGLVDFLTDRNIDALDEEFRERATGSYWVVANLFGLKNALIRLRAYCIDEPAAANEILAELLQAVGANRRIAEVVQNLSLQNLPIHTVRQLRQVVRESVRTLLRARGTTLLQDLSASISWTNVANLVLGRLQKSAVLQEALPQISRDLAAILKRYLDRDLESLMIQVIPILNLDRVIVERVNATSPQNLEAAIQAIVRKELQAIVNLGGVLGFLVGCMQVVTFQFF